MPVVRSYRPPPCEIRYTFTVCILQGGGRPYAGTLPCGLRRTCTVGVLQEKAVDSGGHSRTITRCDNTANTTGKSRSKSWTWQFQQDRFRATRLYIRFDVVYVDLKNCMLPVKASRFHIGVHAKVAGYLAESLVQHLTHENHRTACGATFAKQTPLRTTVTSRLFLVYLAKCVHHKCPGRQ